MAPIIHDVEVSIDARLGDTGHQWDSRPGLDERGEVTVHAWINPTTASPVTGGWDSSPGRGPAQVKLTYDVVAGQIGPNPTALTIGGLGPITAAFPLSQLLDLIAEQIRLQTEYSLDQLDRTAEAAAALEAAQPTRPRGRPALSNHFLNGVAAEYTQLVRSGHRSPAKAIAESRDASYQTARRWITLARKRGFLGKGTPGKAG